MGGGAQRLGVSADAGQLFGEPIHFAAIPQRHHASVGTAFAANGHAIDDQRSPVQRQPAVERGNAAVEQLLQRRGRNPRTVGRRRGAQQLASRRIDQRDLSLAIDRQHPFVQRGEHRLTLPNPLGYLVRLEPQQDPLDIARQAPGARGADQHQQCDTQQQTLAAFGQQQADTVERDPGRDGADDRTAGIEHRRESANADAQRALRARDVGFPGQRGVFVATPEMPPDLVGIGMRQAQMIEIHDGDEIHPQPLAQSLDLLAQGGIGIVDDGAGGERRLDVTAIGQHRRQPHHPLALGVLEIGAQLVVEQQQRHAQRQHDHAGDQDEYLGTQT